MTWALVIEVYREYGLKFDEANEELTKRLYGTEAPQTKAARRQPDDASSMAALQAMMGGSDFKGPRG